MKHTTRRLFLFGALAVLCLGAAPPSFADAPEITDPALVAEAAASAIDTTPAPAVFTLSAPPDLAADLVAAEPPATNLTWQQSLIVVLTPLIIAGLKRVVPTVPGGILPFLAPICGVLLEVVSHIATGADLNVWAAVALGAAGVGLREAVKQTRQAMSVPADE